MNPIVNLKTAGPDERAAAVYCGRPSPLGNPFRLGPDGDRAEVIAAYRRWLWERIQAEDQVVLSTLRAIGPATPLACWCAPLSCHCEVIAAAAAWLRGE